MYSEEGACSPTVWRGARYHAARRRRVVGSWRNVCDQRTDFGLRQLFFLFIKQINVLCNRTLDVNTWICTLLHYVFRSCTKAFRGRHYLTLKNDSRYLNINYKKNFEWTPLVNNLINTLYLVLGRCVWRQITLWNQPCVNLNSILTKNLF